MAVGISVVGSIEDCNKLVQAVVLHAPEVVVRDLTAASAGGPVSCDPIHPECRRTAHGTGCGVHVYLVQGSGQAAMQTAQQAFEAALTYLKGIPLSTPAIAKALEAAGVAWLQMLVG